MKRAITAAIVVIITIIIITIIVMIRKLAIAVLMKTISPQSSPHHARRWAVAPLPFLVFASIQSLQRSLLEHSYPQHTMKNKQAAGDEGSEESGAGMQVAVRVQVQGEGSGSEASQNPRPMRDPTNYVRGMRVLIRDSHRVVLEKLPIRFQHVGFLAASAP